MNDNDFDGILPARPLSRAHTLEVVRKKLGDDFLESNPFIDDLAWALDKSRNPIEFQKGHVVFTVCCGCIITT